MEYKYIFNNKLYSFNRDTLCNFCRLMQYNESIDDNGKKYIISFINNRLERKSYDELDYHEFILDSSVEVAKLICNIDNIFGTCTATKYCERLSNELGEEISIDSEDNYTAIGISLALKIGEEILLETELIDFKALLAAMNLGHCVIEDFEQQLDTFDEYDKLVFISGICVERIIKDGILILKPKFKIYDSPIEKYRNLHGILVPPIILSTILFSTQDTSILEKEFDDNEYDEILPNFSKKYRQLTGNILEISRTEQFIGHIDSRFFGEWYNVYKSSGHPILPPMYHITIHRYNEDGSSMRSVIIKQNLTPPFPENWASLTYEWSASSEELFVKNNCGSKELNTYQFMNGTLVVGNNQYYRTLEEAIRNCDI